MTSWEVVCVEEKNPLCFITLIVVFSCFLQQETLHFYFSLGLQNCVASPIFLNIDKYILCAYSVPIGVPGTGGEVWEGKAFFKLFI